MPAYSLTKPAENDLFSIWRYVADDNPQATDMVLDLIDAQCRLLASNPKIGRSRDDLATGLLSLPVSKASWRSQYLLFYRQQKDGIEVIRILEGHQNIDSSDF